jgi:uncharacterized protein (DUF58 family)
MQLTLRGLALLLGTALWLALAGWYAWAGWAAVAWLLIVLALLVADFSLTPAGAAWQATRRHDTRLSLAADNRIDVAVSVRRALRPLRLWLRDEPPPTFRLTPPGRVLEGTAVPGRMTTLTYHANPPRRGDYAFGDIHLRWESPLGLLRRQARIKAGAPVKVYPNLVDVRKYDLLLRRNRLADLGLRTARIYGMGNEYERLREYLPDDEYRRINWKATARRGKPITTEYQAERSQNVVILLDLGRMMRSPVGEIAKLDYAVNAVLLLTYVATQKGDKVGLLAFADAVSTWMSPRAGKAQFQRMLELLYAVEGAPVEPDYAEAFAALEARRLKHSLVLVFTELTGSVSTDLLLQNMVRLRARHLPLLVTVRDPTVQSMARQPITGSESLYQRTVAEGLLEERRLTLDRLARAGVLTLDVAADELSVEVINRYLEIKERLLL